MTSVQLVFRSHFVSAISHPLKGRVSRIVDLSKDSSPAAEWRISGTIVGAEPFPRWHRELVLGVVVAMVAEWA